MIQINLNNYLIQFYLLNLQKENKKKFNNNYFNRTFNCVWQWIMSKVKKDVIMKITVWTKMIALEEAEEGVEMTLTSNHAKKNVKKKKKMKFVTKKRKNKKKK